MVSREQLLELVKTEFPRLLQEDEEFRTQVLAALTPYLATREDLKLILERLERIENELVELRRDSNARQERMESELVELRRDFNARIERIESELVELRRELVELRRDFNTMQETIKGLQAITGGLRQAVAALENTVHEGLTEVRRGLSRLGIVSEEVLRKTLQTAVETWLQAGTAGRMQLGGREVDVVIRDGKHVILEVTARAHLQDIEKLKRSADDYERQFGVRPRLAIACAYANTEVVRRLVEEGIEIISADLPE